MVKERERNEGCLLKVEEGLVLLGQNLKENGLYIVAHFSFLTCPLNLLRQPCSDPSAYRPRLQGSCRPGTSSVSDPTTAP
jgi:hypothetical protein